MGWAKHVEIVGKKRNEYRILVGKPERYRPLERPGSKFEVQVTERKDGLDESGLRDVQVGCCSETSGSIKCQS
jgi:hypothetical protein